MTNFSSTTNRYLEEDLAEFKMKIEQKLETAQKQLNMFQKSIDNISDIKNNDGDWMDDTSNTQDLQLLYSMVGRQNKHIQDLKNALIRIHNKSYGICVVTGNLIDKRRLLAVLTTTKSIEGKNITQTITRLKDDEEQPKPFDPTKRKIISKVIKRTGGNLTSTSKKEEDIYYGLDDDLNFEDDLDLIGDDNNLNEIPNEENNLD